MYNENSEKGNSKNSVLSIIKKFMLSLLIGLISVAIMFSAVYVVMNFVDISYDSVENISLIMGVLATIISGYSSGRLFKEKGLLYGIISGLLMFLFFLIGGILYKNDITIKILYKALIFAFSGGIGGILGVNKKKSKRK